ncbi:MAG: HAMP domain-containing protein, partial [Nocardioides sp.]
MRRQIAWLVVATTATVVICFVIPLCLLVRALAEDRAKAAADQEARNVAILVAGLNGDDRLPALIAELDTRGTPQTMVRGVDGSWLTGSDAALNSRMKREVEQAAAGTGSTVIDDDGLRVLLPIVIGKSGTAVVRTSMPLAEVRHGVGQAWASIVGLGLALLALALGLAFWMGRRVSAPLLTVAAVAHELREGHLSARAQVEGPPETQELAQALNGLAERTEELLAAERAAVGDLSHRLRTPVTALRLDVESVEDPELAGRLQDHIGGLQR